jgi:hypothetical protein
MKHMGNYASIIRPTTVFDFLTKTGEPRPNEKMRDYYSQNLDKDPIAKEWMDVGYFSTDSTVEWFMYYKEDLTEELDFSKVDFLKEYSEYRWWAVKIMPGKCFPRHVDRYQTNLAAIGYKLPEKDESSEVTRFWMAVEDYHWGHIFAYDDQILHGYKAGDIFEIPDTVHGAGNIGLYPKVSIQIVAKK